MFNIIFLGAPGSGKGTQSKLLAKGNNLAHVSTGDMLREEVKNQTELGKKAKGFMDAGDLVPDDVILGMISNKLSQVADKVGIILDGFPRTLNQAEKLDEMFKELDETIAKVIYLSIDEEVLVKRLGGRRVCPTCGQEYHILYNPPKVDEVCDNDGDSLYQRNDDKEEKIINRLQTYQKSTFPLIEYYKAKELLVQVDASKSIDEVTSELAEKIR